MFISPAFAQEIAVGSGTAAAPAQTSSLLSIAPMVLIFVVFYFLMIRPQQKKVREHQKMVEGLRRGDKVITSGGIIGKIVKVSDDNEATVEIAEGIQIRVVRSTISQVVAKPEPANSNSSAAA
ncbi:MAG: preprotein translocase subunit YajC [Holosporales bacterium]|jgi:preprotein translocase subunit YajC